MPVETLHRFNVKEYYRMAETGVLRPDARVELLDGKVLSMSPIGSSHAGMVKRFIRIFTALASGRWMVSAQDPVRLDEYSEPQPDFMLLKPSPDDYTSRHPEPDDVFLLVEVAEASLDFDRGEKLPAYGRAGILEVWIVNLRDLALEIYREPNFTGYGSKSILRAGDTAKPLVFPDVNGGCGRAAENIKLRLRGQIRGARCRKNGKNQNEIIDICFRISDFSLWAGANHGIRRGRS